MTEIGDHSENKKELLENRIAVKISVGSRKFSRK
jgi:hypothetical protein